MKILCTGNPNKPTLAKSIKKTFDNVDFASTSTGWDLRMWDQNSENYFRNNIKKYDVLINSSFICNGGQMKILNITFEEHINPIHVINIGSTTEYLGRKSSYGIISIDKRALKERSMQLNLQNETFKSTHLTLGGLNDGQPGHENWLNMDHIAETIDWILRRPFNVPLIGIE